MDLCWQVMSLLFNMLSSKSGQINAEIMTMKSFGKNNAGEGDCLIMCYKATATENCGIGTRIDRQINRTEWKVFMSCESESRSVVSNSLRPPWTHSPWNSLGQSTGVGSLSLLQGIFPTKGLNPSLLHCRRILYQLSHKGSPKLD